MNPDNPTMSREGSDSHDDQSPATNIVTAPEPRSEEESPVGVGNGQPPFSSRRPLVYRVSALAVVAVVSILLWRVFASRGQSRSVPGSADHPPEVSVARVTRGTLLNAVPIPAEFRPYQEVELHAKVSGYVSEMKVDFGDRVKAGQLLATLEVPELRDQLANAIAVKNRAAAEHRAAHLNYTRLLSVAKSNPSLVAEQDLDAAEAKDATTEAAIAAAQADADRYQTLLGYTKITAPFDGVVTRRYVDVGALIQSGTASDTQSLPVVRVSDNYHLRLDFPVEVKYVKDVRVGTPVEVQVESLGGKIFSGTISRTTEKVTEDTRTMITEIEVPNPNLELVPGMYAVATLPLQQHQNALSIPLEAVVGEKSDGKNQVYVVNANNQIEKQKVTLGLETPTRYEVLAGLSEGDLVIIAGQSQIQSGQKVTPVPTVPLAEQPSE
jgi:RND family efflux transporter MFP subunit